MQNRQSLVNVKNALVAEIGAALNVSSISLEIEIFEVNTNDAYSVIGNFKVVNLWSNNPPRKGKFTAKLDESLNILNLKLTDETANKQ